MGDGVFVQGLLEQVFGGLERLLVALDALVPGVRLENRRTGEPEQLGPGKEVPDGLVVVAELRSVAFVEDEHHALVAQRFQLLGMRDQAALLAALVARAAAIECKTQLLDGADDHLVGGIVGQHAPYQRAGVGVFLDAAFLEAIELLAGLAIQILAIDHEQALLDGRIGLEQGGCLEAGERLAAAGGVPHVAIAQVFLDALDDVPDGVDLVRPHHQQLLLAGHQHHVLADHLAQRALGQESIGESVQATDLGVVRRGVLVDGQKALIRIEGEMARVVVGEVIRRVAVADDEQLDEAQQGAGVPVARIVLVFDDLLDGATRIDAQRLEFDLHRGNAVDQEQHVILVVAVVRVDPELAGDLERVLAPVVDVNQRVVQRRTVITRERVAVPERMRSGEYIRGDDFAQQTRELAVRELDLVQRLEMLAEIPLQRGAVAKIGPDLVLEIAQPGDELLLDVAFPDMH